MKFSRSFFPETLDTMKGEALSVSSREQPVTCATDGGRAHFTHFGTRSGQTISDIDKKDLTEEEIPATVREGRGGHSSGLNPVPLPL